VQFERRTVPRPQSSIVLRPLDPDAPDSAPWELVCRDGWEWRNSGAPGQVIVRVATLGSHQALVLQDWIERIKEPAVWWAVSRELQSPGVSPEVSATLAAEPWLNQVLPVVLEASTEGVPPPPPGATPTLGN
jgi:hypothetical protein